MRIRGSTGSRGSTTVVDLGADSPGCEELPDDGTPGAPTRGSRGSVWRFVAWSLVLAVVVGGVLLVAEQRRRAAREAEAVLVATQPLRIADLSGGLDPRWHADIPAEVFWTGAAAGVVLTDGLTEDTTQVVALDAETGEQRWWLDGESVSTCGAPPGSEVGEWWGVVQCVAGSWEAPTVQWRDPASGEVLAERETADVWGWATWRDGIVVLDGAHLVFEGADGEVRWTVPIDGFSPQAGAIVAAGREAVLVRSDSRVVVLDSEGARVLDATEPLGEEASITFAALLPGGSVAVQAFTPDGPRSLVLGPAEETLVEGRGDVGVLGFDDGSAGEVFVWQGERGVEVRSLRDGELVGVVDASLGPVPLLLDEGLVHVQQGRLVAADLATGAERWALDVGFAELLGTDGEVVLIQQPGGLAPSLRAIDATTGGERWAYELPGPDARVHVLSGMVLLQDGGSLTRLR